MIEVAERCKSLQCFLKNDRLRTEYTFKFRLRQNMTNESQNTKV